VINRRSLLLGASLAPLASNAHAQANWPQQVVRIVVPFVPGAFTDVSARLLAQEMS
jgi:tripartite-type tricarboxylate transporter receptor subunit TctC